MRGRIESGQLVTIEPIAPNAVSVDDVVFIRWKGNYILHIVKDVEEDRLLIGNNIGKINGWADREDVLGKVTDVADRSMHVTYTKLTFHEPLLMEVFPEGLNLDTRSLPPKCTKFSPRSSGSVTRWRPEICGFCLTVKLPLSSISLTRNALHSCLRV